MANRYWVGGADNWNGTAGSKWALTSGGTGGEAVPTSSDDVFLDAASGTNNVTKSVDGDCLSLTCTGFTGSLRVSDTKILSVFGNLVLDPGMSMSSPGGIGTIRMAATSTGKTVTTNGKSFTLVSLEFNGVGGGWTLQDNLSQTATGPSPAKILLTAGTFDTNGKTVTTNGTFVISGATTRVLTLGSSVIHPGSSWDATTVTNLTLNANTSTIVLDSGLTTTFKGGGLTYNDLTLTPTGPSGTTTISGSNTFNAVIVTPPGGIPNTIKFTAGTTQTATSFVSIGNNIRNIFQSTTGGSAWTLSVASGLVNVTNGSLQDSAATGGASFKALSTTDVSGNSGWTFSNLGGFFGVI